MEQSIGGLSRDRPRERSRLLRPWCMAALSGLMVVTAACRPARSVQSFCATFQTEATRLHDKYQAEFAGTGSSNSLGAFLGAMGALLQAQGDLAVMFRRLDAVAPDEIEPDVAAVRDALDAQAEATPTPSATRSGRSAPGSSEASSPMARSSASTPTSGRTATCRSNARAEPHGLNQDRCPLREKEETT